MYYVSRTPYSHLISRAVYLRTGTESFSSTSMDVSSRTGKGSDKLKYHRLYKNKTVTSKVPAVLF